MTLWDIYDAWTDTALDAPARDNGTHAERIEELIDYTDACSFRDCWDCAPVSDEEAEKIVGCYEHGGAGADELKEIYHVRTYKIEVRHLTDDHSWTEWQTMDETVDARLPKTLEKCSILTTLNLSVHIWMRTAMPCHMKKRKSIFLHVGSGSWTMMVFLSS